MTPQLTDLQLDALRELANIASGTAATSLSQMLAQEVHLNVARALALPTADAVDAVGPTDAMVTAIVLPLEGDLDALVLLLIPAAEAETLCRLLGVDPHSEVGQSALAEIGNILGTSSLNALAQMTGLELLPCPPQMATDMLGAIVASLLTQAAGSEDLALVLESELGLIDVACSISFLLIPGTGGINDLLAPLGLGD